MLHMCTQSFAMTSPIRMLWNHLRIGNDDVMMTSIVNREPYQMCRLPTLPGIRRSLWLIASTVARSNECPNWGDAKDAGSLAIGGEGGSHCWDSGRGRGTMRTLSCLVQLSALLVALWIWFDFVGSSIIFWALGKSSQSPETQHQLPATTPCSSGPPGSRVHPWHEREPRDSKGGCPSTAGRFWLWLKQCGPRL